MATIHFFTKNNCRPLKNHPDEAELLKLPNVVPAPSEFGHLHGVPMHFRKLVEGKIVVMNEEEKAERLRDHELNGVDNYVGSRMVTKSELAHELKLHVESQEDNRRARILLWALGAAALAAAGILGRFL